MYTYFNLSSRNPFTSCNQINSPGYSLKFSLWQNRRIVLGVGLGIGLAAVINSFFKSGSTLHTTENNAAKEGQNYAFIELPSNNSTLANLETNWENAQNTSICNRKEFCKPLLENIFENKTNRTEIKSPSNISSTNTSDVDSELNISEDSKPEIFKYLVGLILTATAATGLFCFCQSKNNKLSNKLNTLTDSEDSSSEEEPDPLPPPTKIEHWWTEVSATQEFIEFKKNWMNLTQSDEAREEEAQKLKSIYQSIKPINLANKSPYNAPLGTVYAIPASFSLWMPGVALVAAYLAKKKKIKGLYVCDTLEALSAKIKEIHSNPADQRYAFVVGSFLSGLNQKTPFGFEPNFPQHKSTVCVEKKGGQLTIALLDAQPADKYNKEILSVNLTDDLWSGYDEDNKFNSQELVFRSILKACRDSECQARLLHSQVLRETIYGCEVFALQDAVAYLRDPEFFNRIKCSKEKTVKIDQQYEIEVIEFLPSEYMIGSQSNGIIEEYRQRGGEFNEVLPGKSEKKKTLQYYLDKYLIEVIDKGEKKNQNHYITKKSFKYLNLASLSFKYLNLSAIRKIIKKTLLVQNSQVHQPTLTQVQSTTISYDYNTLIEQAKVFVNNSSYDEYEKAQIREMITGILKVLEFQKDPQAYLKDCKPWNMVTTSPTPLPLDFKKLEEYALQFFKNMNSSKPETSEIGKKPGDRTVSIQEPGLPYSFYRSLKLCK